MAAALAEAASNSGSQTPVGRSALGSGPPGPARWPERGAGGADRRTHLGEGGAGARSAQKARRPACPTARPACASSRHPRAEAGGGLGHVPCSYLFFPTRELRFARCVPPVALADAEFPCVPPKLPAKCKNHRGLRAEGSPGWCARDLSARRRRGQGREATALSAKGPGGARAGTVPAARGDPWPRVELVLRTDNLGTTRST